MSFSTCRVASWPRQTSPMSRKARRCAPESSCSRPYSGSGRGRHRHRGQTLLNPPAAVIRCQLPCTNPLACTAHILQGRTVPSMLADLQLPPHMKGDEYWLCCYVLLSRLQSIDSLLLLRLPDFQTLDGGPPLQLARKMQRLEGLALATLRSTHDQLGAEDRLGLRDTVTAPLLAAHRQVFPTRRKRAAPAALQPPAPGLHLLHAVLFFSSTASALRPR